MNVVKITKNGLLFMFFVEILKYTKLEYLVSLLCPSPLFVYHSILNLSTFHERNSFLLTLFAFFNQLFSLN